MRSFGTDDVRAYYLPISPEKDSALLHFVRDGIDYQM